MNSLYFSHEERKKITRLSPEKNMENTTPGLFPIVSQRETDQFQWKIFLRV